MTLIIGLSGRARHGKTGIAEEIYRHVTASGFTAGIYDIGDMIRRYCVETGRLPADLRRKDMNREQLEILINVGKEQRAVDVNFWVGRLMQQIAADNFDVALCPNARYESEAQAIRKAGGAMIRVTRLNANGSLFISEDRPPNDISETALEFWSADFYLTAKPGREKLVARQAVAIYEFLRSQNESAIPQPPPVGDGAFVIDYVRDKINAAIPLAELSTALLPINNAASLRFLLQDLIARAEFGKSKYGTYLRTHNGRSAEKNLYQELLDGVMYAAQGRMEGNRTAGTYLETLIGLAAQLAESTRKASNASE